MSPKPSRDHLVLAEGPRIRIRLRTRDDAASEYRWRSDPENARFDGRPAYREPFEQFRELVGYEVSHGRNDREQFAIENREGNHIGTVMLYNFSASMDAAEVGITLGDEAQRGHGLGREAMTVFLRWIWNNRSIRAVYLHALEWNERALRCFKSSGFDEVARVLRDGHAFTRMEARREWWLLWDAEGRFEFANAISESQGSPEEAPTGTAIAGG